MKSILGIGNALTDILAVLPDDSLLKKYNLGCWAISNHLAGQLICDPNNDGRSDGFAPAELKGKG